MSKKSRMQDTFIQQPVVGNYAQDHIINHCWQPLAFEYHVLTLALSVPPNATDIKVLTDYTGRTVQS